MRVGRLPAAAGLIAFAWTAVAAAAPPTRDPKGLALLERIHRAYRRLPAIVLVDTYVRDPGRTCWRRQGIPIDGLGHGFPDLRGTRVEAPRMSRSGWELPFASPAASTRAADRVLLAVDRETLLVRRIFSRPTHVGALAVRALRKAPSVPTPLPRC